jgi:hypothetical protein
MVVSLFMVRSLQSTIPVHLRYRRSLRSLEHYEMVQTGQASREPVYRPKRWYSAIRRVAIMQRSALLLPISVTIGT